MTTCYIFDLDGTLADLSHRLHHIEKKPRDWDAFFHEEEVIRDRLIEHVAHLYRSIKYSSAFKYTGMEIIIASGRSDVCRGATEKWLERHNIMHDGLYMRKAGDKRPDTIVKREMLGRIREDGWQPIMAFDDRDQVVAMWRSNGIPCAQVAPGSF